MTCARTGKELRQKFGTSAWGLWGGVVLLLGLTAGCEFESTAAPPAATSDALAFEEAVDGTNDAPAAKRPPARQGKADATAIAKTDKIPTLRYAWKAGQTYKYQVKIVADKSEELEELSGEPTYTVASVRGDRTELRFQGALHESRKAKPSTSNHFGVPSFDGPPPVPPFFSPFSGVGPGGIRPTQLTVTSLGNVIRQEGSSQLPYLLGNLSNLVIERLPKSAERSWSFTSDTAVTIGNERSRFPGFAPGFPPDFPSHFSPMARSDNQESVAAKHSTSYTIEGVAGNRVTIRKQYEFRADAAENERPPFEVTGTGKLTFDVEQGLFCEGELSLNSVTRQGNTTTEIPVKLTYHLFEQAELAKIAEDAKRKEAERKRPLAAGEIETAIADLQSGDIARVRRASQLMSEKKPQSPNPKMTKALEKLMASHLDAMIRANAAKALEDWATPESVPVLLKAMTEFWPPVRASAIRTLAKFRVKKAIGPVAERLQDGHDRGVATEFLKAMGPDAEDAVLKQLDKGNDWVKPVACSILKEIGTEKSVSALEAAEKSENVFVQGEAKAALEAIRTRAK